MEINVDTKLVPLLGKPLKQSYSTIILNKMYEAEGLNYLRIPIEVDKSDLGEVVRGLRHMNIAGFNVTKPNKIAILKYLDEIDEFADKIGAVNCVVNNDGIWKGYNTDGEGFLKSFIDDTGCDIKKNTFFCFGGGGVGRAICISLAYKGACKIYIVDKCDVCSSVLVDDINRIFGPVAEKVDYEYKQRIKDMVFNSNIIINASGVGMYPNLEETPIGGDVLQKKHIVFDATYNPSKTKLLKIAEETGCKVLNGKRMLVNCIMRGYEYITGRRTSEDKWFEIMKELDL